MGRGNCEGKCHVEKFSSHFLRVNLGGSDTIWTKTPHDAMMAAESNDGITAAPTTLFIKIIVLQYTILCLVPLTLQFQQFLPAF